MRKVNTTCATLKSDRVEGKSINLDSETSATPHHAPVPFRARLLLNLSTGISSSFVRPGRRL
jgi:hypothetical protein